jgi:hypothetical protein
VRVAEEGSQAERTAFTLDAFFDLPSGRTRTSDEDRNSASVSCPIALDVTAPALPA